MKQKLFDWVLTIFALVAVTSYQFIVVLPIGLPLDLLVPNSIILLACSYWALLGSPFPAGPYQSAMTFFVIFFGVVPPLHYDRRILLWKADETILDYYAPAMILALLGILCFQMAYHLTIRSAQRAPAATPRTTRNRLSPASLVTISVAAVTIIFVMNNLSISSVFVRGGESKNLVPIGQAGTLIYQFFVYPIPCIAFVLRAIDMKRLDKWGVALLVLMLISNPPTGMARFQAASLYIAVALSVLPMFIRRRPAIPIGLLFGMLLVFPALDLFRRFDSSRPIALSTDFLFAGHFDSFQSLAAAMHSEIITWGYSLLGVIFFFIPRSIWIDKPIGSGAALAEKEGYSFTNVSMNFLGEGITNFGLLGAVGFMIIAGITIAKLDVKFWLSASVGQTFHAQYLLLIGLVFFIARGDLLSSFAFTAGILSAVWVVGRVARYRFTLT